MPKKKSNKTKGDQLIDELLGVPQKVKTKKGRKKLFIQLVAYSLIWIGLICSLFYQSVINRAINKVDIGVVSGNYKVHFIDVGQGDCSLVQLPDGKNLMIDTGVGAGKSNLVRYLDSLEITQIDYLIITHPDDDHIANSATVFDMCDVLVTYLPPIYSNYDVNNNLVESENGYVTKTSKSWSKTVEYAYKEKSETGNEVIYNLTDSKIVGKDAKDNVLYTVYIYPPSLTYIKTPDKNGNTKEEDWNAYSPFVMVEISGIKYMFAGDADYDDEKNFLNNHSKEANNGFFNCSVLKVGHHGSATSTGESLLNATKPEYAVISCGKGNSYGHPTQTALNMIKNNSSATIKRTDLEGSIVFGTGDNEIACKSNYNYVSDLYFEWKYFVICGGVLIAIGFVFVIKADKKAREKEERRNKTSRKNKQER